MPLSKKAERLLRDKYYIKDKDGIPQEDFDKLCIRVASCISDAESNNKDRDYWLSKYYQLMRELWFLPGGRVIANAGREEGGALFNCYSLDMEDSRESIYSTLKLAAEIFAHGGGVGYNFSKLREQGTPVSNGSEASGPVSFLKLFDMSADVISQASRRGAQLACLNCDHPDIVPFIQAKHKEGDLVHFNTSVGLTDEFMNAAINTGVFPLQSRYHSDGATPVAADNILDTIAHSAWKSGDPGILFLDRLEENNAVPFLGILDKTNPCLPTDAIFIKFDGVPTKFADIKAGDMVWDGKKYVRIVNKWFSGVKEVFEVKTKKGVFRATPDHKVLCNKELIPLKDATKLTYNNNKQYKIWSRRSLGMMETWDFTVDSKRHVACVDGFIVSNCITGDTLVATADGEKHQTIKQLAKANTDIPVYSLNRETGKVEIKIMRHPRVTGRNKRILKIYLSSGSYVRCTEDHKFIMKDGSIKRASNLQCGDKLHHMTRFSASWEESSNSKSQDYIWLDNGNSSKYLSEHRLISEFALGRGLKTGEAVHHKDFVGVNNRPSNLTVMPVKEHRQIHREKMLGKNNPMARFPEKIHQDWSGYKNGRYEGFTPKDVFEFAKEQTALIGRRLTCKEWFAICKSSGYPRSKYSLGEFASFSDMLNTAADYMGIENLSPFALREYKKYLRLREETDLNVFWMNQKIFVRKVCELCGAPFVVEWGRREVSFCSITCAARSRRNHYSVEDQKRNIEQRQLKTRTAQISVFNNLCGTLNRVPLKKEWEAACARIGISHRIRGKNDDNVSIYSFKSYKELKSAAKLNFGVIGIQEDGYEDVYTGTVDDNHNFYIMIGEGKTNSGKKLFNYVANLQCGEAPLLGGESCDLGSINLVKMLSERGDGTFVLDEQKLLYATSVAIRFLDSVHTVTRPITPYLHSVSNKTRKVGLGVMGWADILAILKIPYSSDRAITLAENISYSMKRAAYETSILLAEEKGAYAAFDKNKSRNIWFPKDQVAPTRNAMLLSLAPTGSLSILADVNPGIEPFFALSYTKNVTAGEKNKTKYEIKESNKYVVSGFIPETAHEITPKIRVKMQAAWQKNVDGAISGTINLPSTATVDDIKNAIIFGWKSKLKGMTFFRNKSKEFQILSCPVDGGCE